MVHTNQHLEKEMNGAPAPVLVFAYNRPDHLRKVLESLERNAEAAASVLYVYCDGPKADASDETKANIAAVRKVAAEKKWCGEVHVVAAGSNRGLAASVTGGVEDVLAEHGKVIVLEDDAVCSKYFLEYMNRSLDLYEANEDVISIAGYLYPVTEQLPDTFFLKGADCIAWATWSRGWKYFRYDASLLLSDIELSGAKDHFEFNHSYPYVQMLRDQVEGKIDSWAIRWYASAYLAGKYTLYPGRSMVRNIGFDGSGINSGTSEKWDTGTNDFHPRVEAIPVQENNAARAAIERFFRRLRHVPFSVRVKNAIWSRLPGFIRKAWSGKSDSEVYGWHGDYPTWEAAKKMAGSYDSAKIADQVFAAAVQVSEGHGMFERDGIIFDESEYQSEVPAPTFNALTEAVKQHNGSLHVVDFGGGPGSSYFLYSRILRNCDELKWHVVEQKHFAERGNKELADDALHFFSSVQEACRSIRPDVLLLGSVLHYLETPAAIVRELIAHPFEVIILETTPVVDDDRSHICVQRVPPHIYDASYPCHLFNEQELLSWFPGYTVKLDYQSKAVEARKVDGRIVQWKGYILEKVK